METFVIQNYVSKIFMQVRFYDITQCIQNNETAVNIIHKKYEKPYSIKKQD